MNLLKTKIILFAACTVFTNVVFAELTTGLEVSPKEENTTETGSVIEKYKIDFDKDGKNDLARLVKSSNKNFDTLEIQLTSNKKKFIYDSLIPKVSAVEEGECSLSNPTHREIKVDKNNLDILSVRNGIEFCANESHQKISLQYTKTRGMVVVKIASQSKEWHMGDPSPIARGEVDFKGKRISAERTDHHQGVGVVDLSKDTVVLPRGCLSPTVEYFQQQGTPKCAREALGDLEKKVEKKFCGESYNPETGC